MSKGRVYAENEWTMFQNEGLRRSRWLMCVIVIVTSMRLFLRCPFDHWSSARADWVPGANQIHASGTSLLSTSSPAIDYLSYLSLILEFPLDYWAETSKRSAMPIAGLPTTSSWSTRASTTFFSCGRRDCRWPTQLYPSMPSLCLANEEFCTDSRQEFLAAKSRVLDGRRCDRPHDAPKQIMYKNRKAALQP